MICCRLVFFFFKQKTAYEMRISDWSSDVCSSDLSASNRSGTASVPEMADAGEDHGEAVLVGGGDYLVVADRAARLDHGGGAGLDRGERSEERRVGKVWVSTCSSRWSPDA